MQDKKYMTKADIIRLNDKAIERDFNRSIEPVFYDEVLDENCNYPITMVMPHNPDAPDGGEMRVQISYVQPASSTLNSTSPAYKDMKAVMLDMTPEDYESLPSVQEYLS